MAMPAKDKQEIRPYGLEQDFEASLVALLCTRPRFYGRIGRELDPEAMGTAAASLAVQTCQEIAKGSGSGPTNALIVIQRLRRRMDEGTVTRDEMGAVDDLIAEAEDAGLLNEDDVLGEVVPILKRRIQGEAIRMAMHQYGSKTELGPAMKMLDRAEALGRNDTSMGVKVGGASFGVIDSLRYLDRCPTGVHELDGEIGGGLPRGQLGMFIGGAGAGKSMALSHLAAFTSRSGLFVGYATLELPEAIILARIKANHTGVPIDSIMEGSADAQRKMLENPILGPCYVKEFTPQITTVQDIRAWV